MRDCLFLKTISIFLFQYDKVAVYLPPRKLEASADEKPTSLFATKTVKPSAPQPVDPGDHIYKTYPVFASVIEPIANKFMTLKELIEVNKFYLS